MKQCKCGSYAFNLYKEDIDQGDLCDVHYWKEKALAQPEQEPCKGKNCGSTNPKLHSAECFDEHEFTILNSKPFGYFKCVLDDGDGYWREIEDGGIDGKPLYTTPPQRKPLTDEKIKDGYNEVEWTHAPSAHWFEAGVKFSEAAHGIKE